MPGTVYKVNFLLGFKIDRKINDYFNQVLVDMMKKVLFQIEVATLLLEIITFRQI